MSTKNMFQLRSCIRYESTFKSKDLEKVKLSQAFDDGTSRHRKMLESLCIDVVSSSCFDRIVSSNIIIPKT